MKSFKFFFFGVGFSVVASCGGGGGAPGSDYFGTVFLTTSITKPTVDVDLVNLSLDTNNNCIQTIPMRQEELQKVVFTVSEKANNPSNVQKSPVYIYDGRIRFQSANQNVDPLNSCILTNLSYPSFGFSISGSYTVDITVINQAMKKCIVDRYGISPQTCSSMQFSFGPSYTVYAVLSFKAREIATGIEKSFEINLGTFNLSDFQTGGQG